MRRLFLATLIALFLGVQGFAVSHAGQYGDGPHEHDGIACDIGTLAQDQDALRPCPPSLEPAPAPQAAPYSCAYSSARYLTPPGRAPPPRGPPALF